MSNTDGEDTQKVSLGELLLNAGTRIVDLEKQSNDQVEIITHLEKQLASLREQLSKVQQNFDAVMQENDYLEQQLKQKEDENREQLIEFKRWYDKLTPAQKCTVWPPAGSGIGTGLYTMEDSDLIDKFLSHKKKNLSA